MKKFFDEVWSTKDNSVFITFSSDSINFGGIVQPPQARMMRKIDGYVTHHLYYDISILDVMSPLIMIIRLYDDYGTAFYMRVINKFVVLPMDINEIDIDSFDFTDAEAYIYKSNLSALNNIELSLNDEEC